MNECQYLIKPKGNGKDWCSRYAQPAECEACLRRAGKQTQLTAMYGGHAAKSSFFRQQLMKADYSQIEARILRLTEKEKKIWNSGKWDSLWNRIKRAWDEHKPWFRKTKQVRINAAIQMGAEIEISIQERLMLDKLRNTYQALIVNKYCPECFQGKILAGPEAGGCQNVKCSKCGVTFWVSHGAREGHNLGRFDGELTVDAG